MSAWRLIFEFWPNSHSQGEIKLEHNNNILVSVRGRLKKCVSYWKQIGASKFIIDKQIWQDNGIPPKVV